LDNRSKMNYHQYRCRDRHQDKCRRKDEVRVGWSAGFG
jgi:hypothetical protein